uniref:prolactin-releasing peptide receptor-like n=1 Tax=Pristiophorus japonicus TaxID=55135 RepID=UPI00398F45F3
MVILARGRCGLSSGTSIYMVAMAAADLLVITINVMLHRVFTYHFPHSFLGYTAVCRSLIYLNAAALDMSVWFTVSFTCDRFVSICCEKFKAKYCTVKSAAAIITTLSVLLCLDNIPFWYAYETERIVHNIHWGCRAKIGFFTSAAGTAYAWLETALSPGIPFAVILLCNGLTVRRILVASRARRGLRGQASESQSDPEMANRRKSIILLFTVSGSFILLWVTAAVSYLTSSLVVYALSDYTSPAYIASVTGFMLMYLSSCTNTCIYAATQTKFREELVKMVKNPCTSILTLVKKI